MSINGYEYDYSSVRFSVNGTTFADVQDINYSEKMDRTAVYGTDPEIIGFTRGQYATDGSFTLTRKGFDKLTAVVPQLFDQECTLSIAYSNPGEVLVTETIEGVRITSIDRTNSAGNDPTKVAMNFVAKKVLHNGGNMVATGDILGTLIGAASSVTSILKSVL